MRPKEIALATYLAVVALAGVTLTLWLTPFGAGIGPESTVYVAAAQNLLAGNGLIVGGAPATHFPGLYPVVLAAAGLFQRNLVQAARLLAAVLCAYNLALIAWLVYLAAGRRIWISALSVVFALTSAPIPELHLWAWPEPLFICLFLTGLALMAGYVARPGYVLLLASALAIGLSTTARYLGIGLLPAGLSLVYLARPRRGRIQGLRDAALWLIVACIPLALDLLRNQLTTGSISDARLANHPMPVLEFAFGVTSAFNRMLALDPGMVRAAAALIVLLALYLIIPMSAWRMRLRGAERRAPEFSIPFASLLLCATYLPFIYLSISYIDASTSLDSRSLAPILVLLIVGAFPGIWTLAHRLAKPLAWWSFAAMIGLLILVRAPSVIALAESTRSDGLGYLSRQWRQSATMQYARTLPAGASVYSNAPDALRFLDAMRAMPLPSLTDPRTLQANPRYNAEMQALCIALSGGGVYLVYFDSVRSADLPTKEALVAGCHPRIQSQLQDGTVYGGP